MPFCFEKCFFISFQRVSLPLVFFDRGELAALSLPPLSLVSLFFISRFLVVCCFFYVFKSLRFVI